MSDAIDGRYDDAEGRSKEFVRRRNDESDEVFAQRAMELMIRSGTAFICEHDPATPGDDSTANHDRSSLNLDQIT